jgi:hypothetical protein
MNNPIPIYVRRRPIMRNGQKVPGWQAGLTPHRGGHTSTDRAQAIAAAAAMARTINPNARITTIEEQPHE